MTLSDYILDIALLAIVFRQVRESRFGLQAVLLPIAICTFAGVHYLSALPTPGNDIPLIALFSAIGVILGTVSAMATRVRSDGGKHPLVKAGWIAAGAWVLGMGFRFGFAVWTSHGGSDALGRFSASHDITSAAAWTDALVLMAFGEVFVRTAILWARGRRVMTDEAPAQHLATV